MPIVIYGKLTSPPCRLVWVVAKALGVNVTLKEIDVFKEEQKTEAFEKINPAQTVPTLDENGFQMWESRAISKYLIEKYAKNDSLYPKDVQKRAWVDNILYFDFTLYNAMEEYYTDDVLQGQPASQQRRDMLQKRLNTLVKIIEKRPYAAGDQLTLADIALVTTLSALTICGFTLAEYPTIIKYVAKIKKDLPIYDTVAKAGEDELAALLQSFKA